MTKNSPTMDDPKARTATTVLGVIAAATFMIQPGVVQALVDVGGFDDAHAGYLAAGEMAGLALTTIALACMRRSFPWRPMITAFALIAAFSNLASAGRADFTSLMVFRFLAGLGTGGLTSISFGAVGEAPHPDRAFGFFLMWILAYGAAGLVVLPWIIAQVGLSGFYNIIAAMSLTAIVVARFMPTASRATALASMSEAALASGWRWTLCLGSLLFSLGAGLLWAFAALLGVSKGISAQAVGGALGLSQAGGLAGALSVGILGSRVPRLASLPGLVLLTAVVSLMLGMQWSNVPWLFAVLVWIFNFTWNSIQPLFFGAAAEIDPNGPLVRWNVAIQMTGLAIGPFLGALVLTAASYTALAVWVTALMLLTAALALGPLFKLSRTRSSAMAALVAR